MQLVEQYIRESAYRAGVAFAISVPATYLVLEAETAEYARHQVGSDVVELFSPHARLAWDRTGLQDDAESAQLAVDVIASVFAAGIEHTLQVRRRVVRCRDRFSTGEAPEPSRRSPLQGPSQS